MFKELTVEEMMSLPIKERLEYLREEERQKELSKLKDTEKCKYLST